MNELHELTETILKFRNQRDWHQFHTPKNLTAALGIEAGELQETMLWKTDSEITEFLESPDGRARVSAEVADVMIYALLLCHETGIEPIEAIRNKIAQNEAKYPVNLSKGSSAKYTELRRRNSEE